MVAPAVGAAVVAGKVIVAGASALGSTAMAVYSMVTGIKPPIGKPSPEDAQRTAQVMKGGIQASQQAAAQQRKKNKANQAEMNEDRQEVKDALQDEKDQDKRENNSTLAQHMKEEMLENRVAQQAPSSIPQFRPKNM